MTAINIIKQANKISMITDGLVAGGGLMSKVTVLPHLNLAIACTGAAGAGLMFAAEANQATSYDDLKANVGDVMRHCAREYGQLMRSEAEPDYEIWIAGFSEASGPDFFYAVSHRRRPGVDPYTAISGPGSAQFQPCTPEIWAEISGGWQGRTIDDLDPMIEGPRIIETQRKHLNGQYPDRIGGFCSVTTISRDGITQTIAKRWPLHLGWEGAACR